MDANPTIQEHQKWFIRSIEKILVCWIAPNSLLDNWGMPEGGFGSEGILYVQYGTISWNSPMIKIERGKDDFSNFWGIWKKRFLLLECGACNSGKNYWIRFNSRVVYRVLKKTKTQSIKLFGDI